MANTQETLENLTEDAQNNTKQRATLRGIAEDLIETGEAMKKELGDEPNPTTRSNLWSAPRRQMGASQEHH